MLVFFKVSGRVARERRCLGMGPTHHYLPRGAEPAKRKDLA